jgi:DNA polymerase
VLAVLADPKQDVYVFAANKIGSKDRQLGKVLTLACGYGMGPIKFRDTAAGYGLKLTLKEARTAVLGWRKANAAITGIWQETEQAVHRAIAVVGSVHTVGAFLKVAANKECLMVQLPSGRAIRYWRPSVVQVKKKVDTVDEDGEVVTIERDSKEVRFFTCGRDASHMDVESTYGGKLVENITQAVARDLLAHALLALDDRYPVVCHVHDSIASEVPAGSGSVEEFCSIMATVPAWAPGLPLAASGYRDTRFRG